MSNRGSLVLFRWRGVPLVAHWSVLIGAAFFCHFALRPGALLGYFLVVLIHELGHAAVVRLCGLRVRGIELTGLGGVCYWQGYPTKWQHAAIAWGGVLGQALLFGAAVGTTTILGLPRSPFFQELFETLTGSNFLLAALNLLPVKPLDGAQAWQPLWHWFAGVAGWAERVMKIATGKIARRKKHRTTKLRVVEERDPVETEAVSKPEYYH